MPGDAVIEVWRTGGVPPMAARYSYAVAVLLLLACGAVPATAQADSHIAPTRGGAASPPGTSNSLQALDYSLQPGGSIILRLVFRNEITKAPPVIVSYHPVSNIAFDFHDTTSALAKDRVDIGRGGLRDIVVVQAGTRTRIVINLAGPLLHEATLKGRELWITLWRPEPRASDGAHARLSGAAPDAPRHGVLQVGFERGPSNSGRIVIELADAATPVDVRQRGSTLIVDFLDAGLAPSLERRLDVRDFGTSVQTIETYRVQNRVRVRIELARPAEYSAYQVSRHFIASPQ
jgi:type IV pilus assembly protein PilQ